MAKSYENLERLSEIYEKSGKLYIDVKLKSGLTKSVRAYTAKEYNKMYPGSNVKDSRAKPWDKYYKSQKETLGFSPEGKIWIFVGAIEENEDWFAFSPCREHNWMGWYLPFAIPVPPDLPEGVRAIAFSADGLFDEEDWFIEDAETAFKARLEELIK